MTAYEKKEIYEVLEKAVKRKCRITWSDEDTDARVKEIVEDGVQKMWHKLGMSGEISPDIFAEPGEERGLFLNYCLYEWNDVSEEFENNYKNLKIITKKTY